MLSEASRLASSMSGAASTTRPSVRESAGRSAPRAGALVRVPKLPSSGWRGWVGPILVTAVAALLRFVNLGRPHAVVFDETYYAKDALALWHFGYERDAVPEANSILLRGNVRWDRLDIFTEKASFVVHPPLGKWTIAWVSGCSASRRSGGGSWWRAGTLSVLMTARIIRRLTRSDVVGTLAGLLVALDGLHIVMSRTALLDIILMFFVVAAFGLLLLDRDAVWTQGGPVDRSGRWGPVGVCVRGGWPPG